MILKTMIQQPSKIAKVIKRIATIIVILTILIVLFFYPVKINFLWLYLTIEFNLIRRGMVMENAITLYTWTNSKQHRQYERRPRRHFPNIGWIAV